MSNCTWRICLACVVYAMTVHFAISQDSPKLIEGTGPGWVELGEKDFKNVNCADDTWSWKDGVAHCTGKPTGVIRTEKQYKNFELVVEWRHLKSAGNSGVLRFHLSG